ncbi:hypothetical protein EST62_09090 [Chlorobaculum sp. 24CR]|uniref:hypothetical protein n=1 Tax=Chlorobaculum sp. 24CR TaxID=2508878 RepID=UPI00100B97A6|nr:hypothetical protein [Chlorobaculum sp. 24CR]RXK84597.1 hypothetical protein EST62_09090 [Chlorobaculum sp. 24CR]
MQNPKTCAKRGCRTFSGEGMARVNNFSKLAVWQASGRNSCGLGGRDGRDGMEKRGFAVPPDGRCLPLRLLLKRTKQSFSASHFIQSGFCFFEARQMKSLQAATL